MPGCSPPAGDVVAGFHKPFRRTASRPACSPTTAPSSPANPAAAAGALELELDPLGVRLDHPRPYHPQTCGKVERFHQTQKKWLAAQPRPATLADLQGQLDRFRDYYNTAAPPRPRPAHPPKAYAARPKARPTGMSIPAHYRVRRDKIDKTGVVTLRYNSRYTTSVSAANTPKHVLILVADLYIRVITEDGELLRDDPRPNQGLPTPRPATRATTRPTQTSPEMQRCPETPINGDSRHRNVRRPGIRTPNPVIKSHLLCH